jgi:hypothetical protein
LAKAPAYSMLGWVYKTVGTVAGLLAKAPQMMKTVVNWVGDIVDGLRQDRDGQDIVKPSHLESDLGERSYSRLHPARRGSIYNRLSIPF